MNRDILTVHILDFLDFLLNHVICLKKFLTKTDNDIDTFKLLSP